MYTLAYTTKSILTRQTKKVKEFKKQLDKLYVVKECDPNFSTIYKKVKKEYNNVLQCARKQYYKKKIDTAENKSKSVWNVVNEIRGNHCSNNDVKLLGDPDKIVNDMASYFANAASTLLNNLDLNSSYHPSNINCNEKSLYVILLL